MSNDEPRRYWPLRVRAAYLWILGWKQKDIAEEVDRVPDTIRRWKNDETWAQAKREAEGRWLEDLVRESRQTTLEAVRKGDQELAFKVLERRDDRIRPPEERVSVKADVNVDRQDARERLASRLARATAGGEDEGRPVGAGRNGSEGS